MVALQEAAAAGAQLLRMPTVAQFQILDITSVPRQCMKLRDHMANKLAIVNAQHACIVRACVTLLLVREAAM